MRKSSIQHHLDQIPLETYNECVGMTINKIIQKLNLKCNSHTRLKVIEKLDQLNIQVQSTSHYNDEMLIIATRESLTYSEICKRLNVTICTNNFKVIQYKQKMLKCDVSHLHINNQPIQSQPNTQNISIPTAPEGYKFCQKCTNFLTVDKFHKDQSTKDGVCYICKECKNTVTKERYKTHDFQSDRVKQRAKSRRIINNIIIQGVKTLMGCMVCGENSHYSVLDYHHLHDDKDLNLGQSKGLSLVRIITEIKKCVCLCANCHRKVHVNILDITHLTTITDTTIDRVCADNNIDINNVDYGFEKTTNTCWVYNKDVDLQMMIPIKNVDEYMTKGYMLGIRPRKGFLYT